MNQTDGGLSEAFVIAYYFQFGQHGSDLCRALQDDDDVLFNLQTK